MQSGKGWKLSCTGIAAILVLFFVSSYSGEAQSMARARTKMYRDPGTAFGLELHAPELGLPNYKLPGFGRRITFRDEVEDMDLTEQPELEPEDEALNRWMGYLREKGPSRLIVRNEVERELQPLPDEIWALIAGEKKESAAAEEIVQQSQEYVKVDENYAQIPNKQVGHGFADNLTEDERLRIDANIVGDKSIITQDEPDTYQKLLELFSRPAISKPYDDGYVSFRAPSNSTSAFIRKGSRAKFEIKKN